MNLSFICCHLYVLQTLNRWIYNTSFNYFIMLIGINKVSFICHLYIDNYDNPILTQCRRDVGQNCSVGNFDITSPLLLGS